MWFLPPITKICFAYAKKNNFEILASDDDADVGALFVDAASSNSFERDAQNCQCTERYAQVSACRKCGATKSIWLPTFQSLISRAGSVFPSHVQGSPSLFHEQCRSSHHMHRAALLYFTCMVGLPNKMHRAGLLYFKSRVSLSAIKCTGRVFFVSQAGLVFHIECTWRVFSISRAGLVFPIKCAGRLFSISRAGRVFPLICEGRIFRIMCRNRADLCFENLQNDKGGPFFCNLPGKPASYWDHLHSSRDVRVKIGNEMSKRRPLGPE